MICDVIINVTQQMMAKQHPWLQGLQYSILGQTMSFSLFQLKLLHNGVAHWVVISTFKCKPREINW